MIYVCYIHHNHNDANENEIPSYPLRIEYDDLLGTIEAIKDHDDVYLKEKQDSIELVIHNSLKKSTKRTSSSFPHIKIPKIHKRHSTIVQYKSLSKNQALDLLANKKAQDYIHLNKLVIPHTVYSFSQDAYQQDKISKMIIWYDIRTNEICWNDYSLVNNPMKIDHCLTKYYKFI